MRGEVAPTLAGRDGENDNSAAGSNPALPPGWDQWRCSGFDGRTGKYRGEVFVRARDRLTAKKVGTAAMRIIGIRGRLRLYATPYRPWCDLACMGFVGRASGK